jgi:uncharacterized lipoprotein YmbA
MSRVLLIALTLLSGCALTSKADPLVPRYYTPLARAAKVESSATIAGELRLRRVTAAAHLRERMARQTAGRLYAFSEVRLWTEPPADYLRRALGHALFEARGLRRSLRTSAPTLEVELTAFHDVLEENVARVDAVVWLHVDQRVRFEETFSAQAKIAGGEDRYESFAKAAGLALAEVVDAVAAKVAASLP